jgi:hypothetical protein
MRPTPATTASVTDPARKCCPISATVALNHIPSRLLAGCELIRSFGGNHEEIGQKQREEMTK